MQQMKNQIIVPVFCHVLNNYFSRSGAPPYPCSTDLADRINLGQWKGRTSAGQDDETLAYTNCLFLFSK